MSRMIRMMLLAVCMLAPTISQAKVQGDGVETADATLMRRVLERDRPAEGDAGRATRDAPSRSHSPSPSQCSRRGHGTSTNLTRIRTYPHSWNRDKNVACTDN